MKGVNDGYGKQITIWHVISVCGAFIVIWVLYIMILITMGKNVTGGA